MYLVRVIPLARLPVNAPPVLDYFWPSPLVAGSLVRAPLGRRTISALVVESLDVRAAKIALKSSAFALKKLTGVVTELPQLTLSQLALGRWIAMQYACSVPTAMLAVAPSFIGKRGTMRDHSAVQGPAPKKATMGTVLLTQRETTLSALRDAVGSGKGQTLILVPEHTLVDEISRSLPADVRRVHSRLSATEYRSIYYGVLDGTVRAVIGTRLALFLPWKELSQVLVEDPLHELYKSDMAPRYNAADVARQLAILHGAALTWLTPALSTVQYHLKTTGVLPVEERKLAWPRVTLASVQTEQEAGHRQLFSRAAQEALLNAYEQHEPILIFSARRGYATVARCAHCRAHLSCATCSNPMRWHRTSEDMLVCYHCATCFGVPRQCLSCHAGTLKPSGTPGSQKLAEAVSLMLDRFGYPKLTVPVLDSDLISSDDDSRRVFAQFDAMKNPILVATSMIFSHRYSREFNTILVPHLDMLSSSPDYRTQDRLIVQLEKLADFMPQQLIIQSSQDESFTKLITTRTWDDYFAAELTQRKALRWPPYARIVKLRYAHRDKGVASRAATTAADRMRRVIAHLKATGTHIIGPAPALIERTGGTWVQNIVLKSSLSPGKLSELLQYVPEGWLIDVDPRSIA